MDNLAQIVSYTLTLVGVLVAVTNVIVEVVKKATWDKLPTNILALVVAVALTVVCLYAVAALAGFTVLWYYVVAAVIAGFFVAYAAMFGYDKLKEVLAQIGSKE